MNPNFTLTYCRDCLTPNTRPNGAFNAEGVCTACEFYATRDSVDFDERLRELKARINSLVRHRASQKWDCVIGVSGGKDSTRQALWAREKLGLRPLLVCVAYPPRQSSYVGTRNLSNLISLGFDCITIRPAPRLSRRLVREAFFRFGNWCKATEMALFAGVPQIALAKKIDLILWGENPALQVGDMGTYGVDIWDGDNLRNSNTLAGGDLGWFLEVAEDDRRLIPYTHPDLELLKKHGVHTIFLGPAWSDWSSQTNSAVALLHGFNRRLDSKENTGDMYGTEMVDEDWTVVNNLLKYFKFGFSRGTEQANTLIRDGMISRSEGIEIAESQDAACGDSYVDTFCHYLNISKDVFWSVVHQFTNQNLFVLDAHRPSARFRPGVGLVK